MEKKAKSHIGRWLLFGMYALGLSAFLGQNFPASASPSAPTPSQAQVVVNQIDASEFPHIKLFVSVQDPSGKMLRNLQSQDFAVSEDEVPQSPIGVETQLPAIATVLVLDVSGSMKEAIEDTKKAASSFVELSRKEDELQLITFSDRVTTAQVFTTDKVALKKAIDGIKARGNTALYDAAYQAVRSFGEKTGRKVVILLTDGKDDDGTNKPLSKKTADDVIAAAKETNIPLFTIGLGKEIDEAVLKKMASESGGRYFTSPTSSDLAALYEEISAQLTGQYLLSYTTDLTERDGSWHRVVVKVAGAFGDKQYMAPFDKAAAPPVPSPEPQPKPDAQPQTPTPKPALNVLGASQGTQILMATSQYNDSTWSAHNLIDEAIGKERGYSSKGGKDPQEILFELPKTALLSSMIIDPYTTEDESRWVKDVELWVSTTGPYEGFTKAAAVTVDNKRMESQDPSISLTEQVFPLPETKARWVKVVLKNNHGGPYIQAGEIKLMGYFTEEQMQDPLAGLQNVFSEEVGGKILYVSSQYDEQDWGAKNLIDGQLGSAHGYSSKSISKESPPPEILFVMPKVLTITHVAFNPFTTEDPSRWAKEVEVQVSTEGPKQGFQSIGVFTLHNRVNIDRNKPLPDQIFAVTPAQARFIKLILHKNYGGPYIQLGEFKAYTRKE